VRKLSTAQAARCLAVPESDAVTTVTQLARMLDLPCGADGSDESISTWTAGDVVAMAVLCALAEDGVVSPRWADGAATVGDAFDKGEQPSYLITRADGEFAVVLDEVGPTDRLERTVARIIDDVTSNALALRIVCLRPILSRVTDWIDTHAA
jgi:hypothetical protein